VSMFVPASVAATGIGWHWVCTLTA
jgi:hypothetical protein